MFDFVSRTADIERLEFILKEGLEKLGVNYHELNARYYSEKDERRRKYEDACRLSIAAWSLGGDDFVSLRLKESEDETRSI